VLGPISGLATGFIASIFESFWPHTSTPNIRLVVAVVIGQGASAGLAIVALYQVQPICRLSSRHDICHRRIDTTIAWSIVFLAFILR